MNIGVIHRYFTTNARFTRINNGIYECKIVSQTNKQVAFNIHPKQINEYSNIHKRHKKSDDHT